MCPICLVDLEILHMQENITFCIRRGPRAMSRNHPLLSAICSLRIVRRSLEDPVQASKIFRQNVEIFGYLNVSVCVCCRVYLQRNDTTKMTAVTVGSFHGFGEKSSRQWYFTLRSHLL